MATYPRPPLWPRIWSAVRFGASMIGGALGLLAGIALVVFMWLAMAVAWGVL